MTSGRDLKQRISQRGTVKQDGGGLNTSRGGTKSTSEERLWRLYYVPTWDKKARKTEPEMDGLCQLGHESHRNDKR